MDLREAFQLLTLASARDGRTVDKEVAAVWAKDLERVDIGDAVEAATDHYRRSDKWLMPSHVIDGVRMVRERRDRAERIQRAIESGKGGGLVRADECPLHPFWPLPCAKCNQENQ